MQGAVLNESNVQSNRNSQISYRAELGGWANRILTLGMSHALLAITIAIHGAMACAIPCVERVAICSHVTAYR